MKLEKKNNVNKSRNNWLFLYIYYYNHYNQDI